MRFVGMSFPFRISPTTGGIQTAKYDDTGDFTLLRQSIHQILMTQLGERIIEKDFGSDIAKKVFDPLDDVMQQALSYTMLKALATWEPRITVTSIEFYADYDKGTTTMKILYTVNRTGAQDSAMVPVV